MSKREVSMRIIGNAGGGCSDGTCPTIWKTDDPEIMAVQGAILADAEALADIGEIPGHETVVLIPRSLLEGYRREVS
jgi:hypothetical protein